MRLLLRSILRTSSVSCFLFCCFVFPLNAQTGEQAIDQVEQVNRLRNLRRSLIDVPDTMKEAPSITQDELEDVGPQYLLRFKPRREWFEALFDVQYYYTSNFNLNEKESKLNRVGEIDTGVLVSTAQFAFAPTPFRVGDGWLSPKAGYRHQWYNYGLDNSDNQLNNFDFDVQTFFGELTYNFLENWYARVGLSWTRLLNHEDVGNREDYSEFYKEYLPEWEIQRFIKLGSESLLVVGYEGNYHHTEVDPLPNAYINDRMDHMLTINYLHQLTPHIVLQPYYRFTYTDYWENGDRNDFLHSLGLIVSYHFNRWSNLRLFVNYDKRESDDPLIPDYEKVDAGGGATLILRF